MSGTDLSPSVLLGRYEKLRVRQEKLFYPIKCPEYLLQGTGGEADALTVCPSVQTDVPSLPRVRDPGTHDSFWS